MTDVGLEIPVFLKRNRANDLGEPNSERNVAGESPLPASNLGSPAPTVDALAIVSKYIELRDYVEAETKAFNERLAPVHNAMEVLSAAAGEMMRATKQKALSTEAGTAYESPGHRVTCQDVHTFHEWVFKYEQRAFLTAHVSKDAVVAYMDAHEGHHPPGLKVEPYTKINFRRK
jgi:hypothetical protein